MQYRRVTVTDGQTDGQIDGIAVASTALAKRCAVTRIMMMMMMMMMMMI